MNNKKQPIPFIQIKQDEKGQTKFIVNKKIYQLFTNHMKKFVSVVAIAGPQRTGKSFLANRLLKRMDGFAIGPSTNPCTKGIWIWSDPIVIDDQTILLIIDTEGLNSVQRDQTIDSKIFSISILLSSIFIYNSIGHIDEKAIENLSLVINISKSIVSGKGQDQSKLSDYFPVFYWVLRDFSLELKDRTQKQYLQECLDYHAKQGEIKNGIRKKIKIFFPIRHCQCFPRPLNQEGKLAYIEKQPFDSLRPAFKQRILKFQNKFFENIHLKTLKGKAINCEMFLLMVQDYIEAINSGGVPNISSTLQRVIQSEARKIKDQLKMLYHKTLNQNFSEEKLPIDENNLEHKNRQIKKQILMRLDNHTKNLVDTSKMIELRDQIIVVMDKQFKDIFKVNSQLSESKCNELLSKFFSIFQVPQISSLDQVGMKLFQDKFEQFAKYFQLYMSNTKLPYKTKIFCQRFPMFIFEYFQKLMGKMKALFNQENIKMKSYIKQYRQVEDRLKSTIKEQSKMLMTYQKDKQGIRRQLEQIKRDNTRTVRQQNYEIERIKQEAEGNQQKIDHNKNKLKQLKEENSNLQLELNKLRKQNQTLKIQNQSLIEGQVKSQKNNQKEEINILSTIAYAKDCLDKIIQDLNKRKNSIELLPKYQIKVKEISEEKFMVLQEKKQYDRNMQVKKNIEQERIQNEKKMEIINKYLDNLKKEKMEMHKRLENLPKHTEIKGLIAQNNQLSDNLTLKQQLLENIKVKMSQMNLDLEKKQKAIQDLQNKIAIINVQRANMICLKQSFPYVLRQALNWVMQKSSKLKQALKNLSQEDSDLVKQVFLDVGIKNLKL